MTTHFEVAISKLDRLRDAICAWMAAHGTCRTGASSGLGWGTSTYLRVSSTEGDRLRADLEDAARNAQDDSIVRSAWQVSNADLIHPIESMPPSSLTGRDRDLLDAIATARDFLEARLKA